MVERDLGSIPVGVLDDGNVSRRFFIRIDFKSDPPGIVRYTNKVGGFVGDIGDVLNGVASGSATWTEYDFRTQNLSQTQNNILEVSAIDVTNALGQWSEWLQVYGLREQPIGVYVVWFDAVTDAVLGMYQIFAGQIDATEVNRRANLSLTPFTTPHSVIAPAGEYSGNCVQNYKDEFCQYAGDLPSCDRTIDGVNGCRVHENVIHFAGFPFLPPPNTTMIWAGTVKVQPG